MMRDVAESTSVPEGRVGPNWQTQKWEILLAKNLSVGNKGDWAGLGWENPLEKDMATDSSILSWRIPWTEEPGRLQD